MNLVKMSSLKNKLNKHQNVGGATMRAKLYEKYYKLGFDHYIFKNIFGLQRPDKNIKRFYYAVIAMVLMVGFLIS